MRKIIFFSFLMLPIELFASGAFIPGGAHLNEKYHLGKAIVAGRVTDIAGCKSCHKKFSRAKLQTLEEPVSLLITECDRHKECYKDIFTDQQMSAIDIYFSKRYKLR